MTFPEENPHESPMQSPMVSRKNNTIFNAYPLVNIPKTMEHHHFLMRKSTIYIYFDWAMASSSLFANVLPGRVPSGELTVCYWKWPSRNSGFSHEKWWIFPVRKMLVHQAGSISLNPIKPPFSYGFPMVFLWLSYGFPMVFLWKMVIFQALDHRLQPRCHDGHVVVWQPLRGPDGAGPRGIRQDLEGPGLALRRGHRDGKTIGKP